MRIGSSVALIVIGAVLSFAVTDSINGIDLTLIGYIFMGAGALLLILSLIYSMRRRTAVSTSQTSVDPVSGNQVTRNESSIAP
jgi:hypothetical protein